MYRLNTDMDKMSRGPKSLKYYSFLTEPDCTCFVIHDTTFLEEL